MSSTPDSGIDAESYVDGGEIKIAKLASTLVGAVWLTVIGGWITLMDAVTRIHIRIITLTADRYELLIRTLGSEGAETLSVGWAAAFRSAIQASPLAAPMILSLEIILVSAILIAVHRRLS